MLAAHSEKLAFIQDGPLHYHSRGDQPVARLIQAIYDLRPEDARRILRGRIYSNTPASEMELAMVKVAAKRISAPVSLPKPEHSREIGPESPPPLLNPAELPEEIRALLENREFMKATLALSRMIPRKSQLYESDRRVAALLVNPEGQVIAAALNSNARNRTRHAEVNLVQGLLAEGRSAFLRGSRIFVSLKCCKMCAAMIWCAAEDVSELRVYYAENDPGPNARSTVFTPHSFERKRASRNEQDHSLELEFHQPA